MRKYEMIVLLTTHDDVGPEQALQWLDAAVEHAGNGYNYQKTPFREGEHAVVTQVEELDANDYEGGFIQ